MEAGWVIQRGWLVHSSGRKITEAAVTISQTVTWILETCDEVIFPTYVIVVDQVIHPVFWIWAKKCGQAEKKETISGFGVRVGFPGTQRIRTALGWYYLLTLKKWSESHSVMFDSLRPHGLYSSWNSPGQNTGVGSLSLLQGIFPTQGSNPGLLHWGGIFTSWATRVQGIF